MSRAAVGAWRRGDVVLPLALRRSGSEITFEVDGRPTYRLRAQSSGLAVILVERFVWWLERREFPSFDALHEHVVEEYDRARCAAARAQRASVFRRGPGGALE